MNGKPRLPDQVRERIRFLHYSIRTEEACIGWIRRFILFHGKRHPRDMGAPGVEAFRSDLATLGRVTAATQNQALSEALFLYRQVLWIELPWMEGIKRAKRPSRLPVVMTPAEGRAVLARLDARIERVREVHRQDLEPGSVRAITLRTLLQRYCARPCGNVGLKRELRQ